MCTVAIVAIQAQVRGRCMGGDPIQPAQPAIPVQPAMAVPIHARGITIAGAVGLAMFGFVKLQLQHKLFILSIFQVDFLLNFSQLRLNIQ